MVVAVQLDGRQSPREADEACVAKSAVFESIAIELNIQYRILRRLSPREISAVFLIFQQ